MNSRPQDSRDNRSPTRSDSKSGGVQTEELRRRPWWESKLAVGLVTAVLALIVPTTTVVLEDHRADGRMKFAMFELDQRLKLEYLRIVVDHELGQEDRQVVLSFMARAAHSEDTKRWARDELNAVRKSAEALEERMTAVETNLAQFEDEQNQRLVALEEELSRKPAGDTEKVKELRNELSRLRVDIRKAEMELHEMKVKLEGVDGKIPGYSEVVAAQVPSVTSAVIRVWKEDRDPRRLLTPPGVVPPSLLIGEELSVTGSGFGLAAGAVVLCNSQVGTCGMPLQVIEWKRDGIRAIVGEHSIPGNWDRHVQIMTAAGSFSEPKPVEVVTGLSW